MRNLKISLGLLRDKYFLQFISSIVAMSGLLFGFDVGVISGAIVFISKEFHLSGLANGLVVSSILFAAFVGAISSGRLADYLGRRRLLIFTAATFIVGTLLITFSHTLAQLIIGRVVLGIAVGVSSFVAPMYAAEIAPAKSRGTIISYYQFFTALGLLFAYIVAYCYSFSGNWHGMFEMGLIPAVLFFLGVLVIPESPRWILMTGHDRLARQILSRVRSNGDVDYEIEQIKNNLQEVRSEFKMLLRPWIVPAVVVGIGLAVFRQITGLNTIIYYAPTVLQMAGAQYLSRAIFGAVIIGFLNVIFTLLALQLVDKWGRKPLMLYGLGGMLLSLIFLALAFMFGHPEAQALRWLAWVCTLIYISCFAFGIGAVTFVMIAEIFPLRVRGLASSLSIAVNWGLNGVVALTFLTLVQMLTVSGVFWMYAGICLLALFFVYFFIPETKGVSLEQIESNLRAGKSGRHLGDVVG